MTKIRIIIIIIYPANGLHTPWSASHSLVCHDTLASAKDMACESGHLHVVRADFSIALDDDSTFATAYRCRRYAINYNISAYRSFLTTAIDALAYLGISLNGDRTVATHQTRVAVSIDALTGTKDATFNHRRTGCSIVETYCHRRAPFHAAYLTATIDVASSIL